MAGFLSGFEKLGLGNIKGESLFEDPAAQKKAEVKKEQPKRKLQLVNEEDYLYDKKIKCPVCDLEFVSKTVRTGKVKIKAVDIDLRPDYDELDQNKYDVVACTCCGYAALARYFPNITKYQVDDVKLKICMNYRHEPNRDSIYSYDYSKRLYQLALANAVVKKAKNSEKAYICLKTAWVIRGETQRLDPEDSNYETKKAENDEAEKELLTNAYNGFMLARQSESYPIAGMDQTTLDYLLAALAVETDQKEIAGKMINEILSSRSANARIKDRARLLKEMLQGGSSEES